MKTPIQELIDFCISETFNCTLEDGTKMLAIDYDDFRKTFDNLLNKEKAFAFDCYNDGYYRGACQETNDFEDFYSEYAEQHSCSNMIDKSIDRDINNYLFKDVEQHNK